MSKSLWMQVGPIPDSMFHPKPVNGADIMSEDKEDYLLNSWKGVALDSSNLLSCDYEGETEELTIRFVKGGVYVYDKVPRSVAAGLIEAESPGNYFFVCIKGKFTYHKQ